MMDFNINKLEISSLKFPEILSQPLLTVREINLVYLCQQANPSFEFLLCIL